MRSGRYIGVGHEATLVGSTEEKWSGLEYARVGKRGNRDGIEKFLYDHYKPECNKNDPGGTPIEVNLP